MALIEQDRRQLAGARAKVGHVEGIAAEEPSDRRRRIFGPRPIVIVGDASEAQGAPTLGIVGQTHRGHSGSGLIRAAGLAWAHQPGESRTAKPRLLSSHRRAVDPPLEARALR
jgi:hypothetical protein